MRKNTLVAIAVVASLLAFGSIVQDFRLHHSLADTRASSLAVNAEISALDVALSDFRAAQTGYLAAGQGPDFWMRRATDLSGQLGNGLDQLRAETTSVDARASYDAASAALSDLQSIDKRVRDSLQSDQRFVASDLVFVDGLEASQRFDTALAAARTSEARTADAAFVRTTRWQLALTAGPALVALMALLVVTLVTPAPAVSEAAVVAQMIRDLPPAVKPATAAAVKPAAVPTPPPVPVPVLNLSDTADLCVDLARVIDDRDIPALLHRTAKVLDAKGVIVWVANRAGSTLRPTLTHGYSDKVIAKLGVLDVAADNVTSLSFRSIRPQTMNGTSPGSAGAIAVPLVTTAGCSGVLSAEVCDDKPTADVIALAKIIAAQFATLIGPDEMTDARVAQA